MKENKEDVSVLILAFIPVVIAIGRLVADFDIVDVIYLLLVFFIFMKYFCKNLTSQKND